MTLLLYIMFHVEVKQGHIEQIQTQRPLYREGVTSMKGKVATASAQISAL